MSKKLWKADGEEAHRQVLDLLNEHEGRSFSQSDNMEKRTKHGRYSSYFCPLVRTKGRSHQNRHLVHSSFTARAPFSRPPVHAAGLCP
ncbi:MAG: hypothetical protein GX565_14365 [Lentisphaerae bacterium]|nr:hypothetical protein [Lentisphaerota bacterium]